VATQATSSVASPAAALLTTSDIIALHRAGVDDSILFSKLEQQNTPILLSTDDVLQLKAAGVSDAVMQAIIQPQLPPIVASLQGREDPGIIRQSMERRHSIHQTETTTPDNLGAPSTDLNNPLAPHDPGIYLATQAADGSTRMVYIRRNPASNGGATGMLGLLATVASFGTAPIALNITLPKPRAAVRATDTQPVFYFYLEDTPGKTPFLSALPSSPDAFLIAQFSQSKKERLIPAGKLGLFTASLTPVKSISFREEFLHTGLYKVTPELPLQPGEYCFLLQNPIMYSRDPQTRPEEIRKHDKDREYDKDLVADDIFDFGIDARRSR
jgi:hypothetical protein